MNKSRRSQSIRNKFNNKKKKIVCLLVGWRIREGNKAADYADNNDIWSVEAPPVKERESHFGLA